MFQLVIFLQTYAIAKQIKPDTTQMKHFPKGFTSITNFNPFFYVMIQKKSFNDPPFFISPRLKIEVKESKNVMKERKNERKKERKNERKKERKKER